MITKNIKIEAGNQTKDVELSNGKNNNKLRDNLFNRADINIKINLVKERAENTVWLGFEKAVAHYENPSMYPLPAESNTVERAFHDLLTVLPNLKRKKLADKINETLKAGSAARVNRYKDLVNVNFNSTLPVTEQVKAMQVPGEMIFTEEEGTEIAAEYKRKAEKPKNTGYTTSSNPVPQQAASASKISFFVDNMTCLNPDDVRKDEINLAGFSIDSTGSNVKFGPFFVGKFRKNETVLLGDKSKLFTLNIDPNQIAQSFIAGLFIIESDLISNQDTVDKLSVLFVAIGTAISAVVLALIIITVVVVPLVTLMSAMIFATVGISFQTIGFQFIPLMGDDISFEVTDTLAIADKVDIGETFARTLTIGKGRDPKSTFDGKYTATARWIGEA